MSEEPYALEDMNAGMSPRPSTDWGPIIVAVILFVVLSPGLLFQLPGHCSFVEFGNLHTSAASIVVHSIIFFALITVFVIVVGVHITTGDQPAY